MQIGQDLRQDMDRIGRRAAEHARMQVAVGAVTTISSPTRPRSAAADRRRLADPTCRCRRQREVGLQLVGIGLEERLQRRRADSSSPSNRMVT
jgi:hypothetical protein